MNSYDELAKEAYFSNPLFDKKTKMDNHHCDYMAGIRFGVLASGTVYMFMYAMHNLISWAIR